MQADNGEQERQPGERPGHDRAESLGSDALRQPRLHRLRVGQRDVGIDGFHALLQFSQDRRGGTARLEQEPGIVAHDLAARDVDVGVEGIAERRVADVAGHADDLPCAVIPFDTPADGVLPGNATFANVSLTMSTGGAPARSEADEPRPRRTGIPMTPRYSGLTMKKCAIGPRGGASAVPVRR